jgi:hypothetical protein
VYDPANAEHVALLKRLWRAVHPKDPVPEAVSADWERIGFQGANPATDFRGMGLLGLDCLVFFAEHYPSAVRQLFELRK